MEINLNDFKNLDIENIGEWPPTVKVCGAILVFLMVGLLGWQYDLKTMENRVREERSKSGCNITRKENNWNICFS